jgi:hypothetical protein
LLRFSSRDLDGLKLGERHGSDRPKASLQICAALVQKSLAMLAQIGKRFKPNATAMIGR